MRGFLTVLTLTTIAAFGYFYKEIINFATNPIIWKIQGWMLLGGTWGIWKCQYFIWQKKGEGPLTDEDTGRRYRSLEEARYKEFKHQVQKENIGREVQVENWIDTDGSKYFVFRVIHELGEFLYIPFKIKD